MRGYGSVSADAIRCPRLGHAQNDRTQNIQFGVAGASRPGNQDAEQSGGIPARRGLPGCDSEPGRIRTAAAVHGNDHGDVEPDGWFSHA
jgi:hypothetical protein